MTIHSSRDKGLPAAQDLVKPRNLPSASGDSMSLTRRGFLQVAGTALAGGAASLAMPRSVRSAMTPSPSMLREHPNILIIITDQERYPQHWPDGWAALNLPNRKRLADNGLTFTRAFCNSTMCSPSRANLFTGLYSANHGVERTLTYGGILSGLEKGLPLGLQNMARMLETAGYRVVLKGKWHLSKSASGGAPSASDVAAYGFNEWESTTAGEAADVDSFGGGCAGHDITIKDEAVAFLNAQTPVSTATNPFALIVCFANPHDVIAYPKSWDNDTCAGDDYGTTADFDHGISVPGSYAADNLSTKPTPQDESRRLYAVGLDPLLAPTQRARYVNFYADLHKVVDEHIGDVLDAMANQGLTESTMVVHTSDHGEMGLAHSGLRQKMFNAYEETIHVPLVISNPTLFTVARATNALASSVDVMPTLASLANVPNLGHWVFRGFDLSPIISDPTASVQDAVLFTFDDQEAGTANGQPTVTQPNHIRCIRLDDGDGEWKFARYFDPSGSEANQYEMYHLTTDPDELDNLANPSSANYDAAKATELAAALARLEATRLAPLRWIYLPLVRRSS